ncbi:ABC transporter permease [Janibacter cremeus]|nr:ABC transporter permease [Janibacter cremeus]WEV79752.1 ABC transporter permease [Janibacter cremeus]
MGFAGRHAVVVAAIGSLTYLLLPIAVVILQSFNKPAGRYNTSFNEFTLSNWTNMCAAGGMCDSVVLSLQIAVLATIGATVLGSAIAFALVRHRFRGRSSINMLIFLPMATPEVVMGSSLLTLFVSMQMRLGFWTLLIAHIMFTLSFVVVTVKARLSGLDPNLEEAARDLYANAWSTFWRVTFPLALPGIMAAAMLAFALSFDDFIVSNFNAGNEVNFPMFVWGASRRGVPPQVNVIGTLMFVVALLAVVGGQWAAAQRHRNR